MVKPTILLLCLAILIYSAYWLVGYGINKSLQRLSGLDKLRFPSVFIGLSLIQISAWVTLYFTGSGLLRATPWIFGVFVFMTGYAVSQSASTRALRSCFSEQLRNKEFQSVIASTVVVVITFVIQWRTTLSKGFLTLSSPNGDPPAYVQMASHIERFSFNFVGKVSGVHTGRVAQSDVSGAYEYLAFNRIISGRTYSEILLPSLLIALILVAQGLTVLLQRHFKLRSWQAVLCVVFANSLPLQGYISANYFISQLMGIAVTIAFFILMCEFRKLESSHQSSAHLTLIAFGALIMASGILTYPHMMVVASFILGMTSLRLRETILNLRTISFFVISLGLAALLVFGRMPLAIDRAIALAGDRTNGWALPVFLPSELLGWMSDVATAVTVNDKILSVAILVGVALLVMYLRRFVQKNAIDLLIVTVAVGCSYALVYQRQPGPSYQQWKWISFFLPLLVAVFVGLFIKLFIEVCKKSKIVAPIVVSALVVSAAIGNIRRYDNFYETVGRQSPGPSAEEIGFDTSPAFNEITSVNVKTGGFMGSMWPATFLGERQVAILDPAYYTATEPLRTWTLIRSIDKLKDLPKGSRRVSESYVLVPFPRGRVSMETAGLSADIKVSGIPNEVRVGEEVTFTFSIANNGVATWLGSGALKGNVNLGIRVTNADETAPVTVDARAPLVDFPRFVAPGEVINGQAKFVIPIAGKFVVEVGPVSESVSWFSDLSSMYAFTSPIEAK